MATRGLPHSTVGPARRDASYLFSPFFAASRSFCPFLASFRARFLLLLLLFLGLGRFFVAFIRAMRALSAPLLVAFICRLICRATRVLAVDYSFRWWQFADCRRVLRARKRPRALR